MSPGKVANFKARSRSEVIDCSNLFYIESETLKLAILGNFGHGKDTECLGKGIGSLWVGFIKPSIYRTNLSLLSCSPFASHHILGKQVVSELA